MPIRNFARCFYVIKPINFSTVLWHTRKNGFCTLIKKWYSRWLKHWKTFPKLFQKESYGDGLVIYYWTCSRYILKTRINYFCSNSHEISKMNGKLLFHSRLVNRRGQIILPDRAGPHFTNDATKFEGTWIWCSSLPSSFPRLLSFRQPLIRHLYGLLREEFKNQTDADRLFKEFISFRTAGFYVTGINRY